METSSASPHPARYRGFSGAAIYGLMLFGIMVALGLLGGAFIGMLLGQAEPALFLVTRMALFGAVAGVASALGRWLCGGVTDRLVTIRLVRGDLGGLGLLAGLIVAGYFTKALPELFGPAPKLQEGGTIEIAGPTVNGKSYDLRDHRGKVVLVDFWASWCPPCVGELPNVRAVYDKYHAEGFDVVGVSLDAQRQDLERFVKGHPEPWPQIFFDQTGQRFWDNPLARRYGIRAIPFMAVVDRDGRVAATNVRGEEVETAVARALGRDVPEDNALLATAKNVITWFFRGVFAAEPWLLFLCGVGGAVLLAGVEVALRRALRRRAAAQAEGTTAPAGSLPGASKTPAEPPLNL